MRWLPLLLLLTTSCSVKPQGFHDFVQYQFSRNLIKIADRDNKENYREDPSMSYEEFDEIDGLLDVKRPRTNFVTIGSFCMDSGGKVRYRGVRDASRLSFGSENPFFNSLRLSLSFTRAKFRLNIYDGFDITYKQKFNGGWQAYFNFELMAR